MKPSHPTRKHLKKVAMILNLHLTRSKQQERKRTENKTPLGTTPHGTQTWKQALARNFWALSTNAFPQITRCTRSSAVTHSSSATRPCRIWKLSSQPTTKRSFHKTLQHRDLHNNKNERATAERNLNARLKAIAFRQMWYIKRLWLLKWQMNHTLDWLRTLKTDTEITWPHFHMQTEETRLNCQSTYGPWKMRENHFVCNGKCLRPANRMIIWARNATCASKKIFLSFVEQIYVH